MRYGLMTAILLGSTAAAFAQTTTAPEATVAPEAVSYTHLTLPTKA